MERTTEVILKLLIEYQSDSIRELMESQDFDYVAIQSSQNGFTGWQVRLGLKIMKVKA